MESTSPFINHNFTKLFAAQLTALAGSGLATIALALLAYDLAEGDAGKVLGTALALKMVAYVIISPIAGSYASMLPRRQLLVGLDIARALVVVMLPFVTQIWQVYVLIFLLSACSAVFTPVFQATIPDLLPDDAQYTRALSLSRLAYDLENLVSPTVAAIALTFLSYHLLFVANAITFGLSALLVLWASLPTSPPSQFDENAWARTTFGIRAYLKTPRLRGLLALSFAVATGGAMVIVNTVVYVRDYLGGNETQLALVMACYGAGSMIVALAMPKVLDRFPDRPFMMTGAAIVTASLIAGIAMPGYIGLFVIWFLLGAGSSMIQAPAGRLLKRSSNEESRNAIYAAQFALSHACWLIAYPLGGWAGSLAGLDITFGILAVATFFGTVCAFMIWPVTDKVMQRHTHDPIAHEHVHSHDVHHQHQHEGWEGPEPHRHFHRHDALTHEHAFSIDHHHLSWPSPTRL